MAIRLPPQLEAMIRERVERGQYPDEAAVIDEALRLLDERDRLDHLRALVDAADAEVARGEAIEWVGTPDFLERLKREAADANRLGVPIPDDVLP